MIGKYASVQYELLRPAEVKSRQAQCSIAYLPFGSLEWHGVQNPLGTDGLKAHAICCEAALRFGGVVLPTLFLGILGQGRGWGPQGWSGYTVPALDPSGMEEIIYRVARSLVANDWRVLVGVTGHDIPEQRNAVHNGIQRACVGTEAKGFGVTEGENWEGGSSMEFCMDHAGAWETSTMMHAHPDRVDLNELERQMRDCGRMDVDPIEQGGPEGIIGRNPLKHASPELGKRIIEFCAERIGKKAVEVLDGHILPPERPEAAFMDNPGPSD